jgi:hypothetical protein
MFDISYRRMTILLVVVIVLGLTATACGASPAATEPVVGEAEVDEAEVDEPVVSEAAVDEAEVDEPVVSEAEVIAKAKAWTGSDWLDSTDAERLQIARLWNEKIRVEYSRDFGASWWSDSLTTFYLCGNIEDDPKTDCRGGQQGAVYLGMTVHMALDSVCVVDLELCPDHYYDESSW